MKLEIDDCISIDLCDDFLYTVTKKKERRIDINCDVLTSTWKWNNYKKG